MPDRVRGFFDPLLGRCPMKIANVASTAPRNIWTSDEFVVLVRNTVANLLDVDWDDLLKADEAEVRDAVMQVCSEINCQVTPAGNA
jgi:hypothetical protein